LWCGESFVTARSLVGKNQREEPPLLALAVPLACRDAKEEGDEDDDGDDDDDDDARTLISLLLLLLLLLLTTWVALLATFLA
jgi:hypothetical protein